MYFTWVIFVYVGDINHLSGYFLHRYETWGYVNCCWNMDGFIEIGGGEALMYAFGRSLFLLCDECCHEALLICRQHVEGYHMHIKCLKGWDPLKWVLITWLYMTACLYMMESWIETYKMTSIMLWLSYTWQGGEG